MRAPVHVSWAAAPLCLLAACGSAADGAGALPTPDVGDPYAVRFSTLIGGRANEQPRGAGTTASGELLLVGGSGSDDFPTTEGVLQPGRAGGVMDVFVLQLGRDGELDWSTFLGGKGYDRAYSVRTDAARRVYVAGRAGPGFPLREALQNEFAGDFTDNAYGPQDGFLACLSEDGGELLWSTYLGDPGPGCVRDLDVAPDGTVHFVMLELEADLALVPERAFLARRPSDEPCGLVAQLAPWAGPGHPVELRWASYLGGTAKDSPTSVAAAPDGGTYVAGITFSADFPVAGEHADAGHGGGKDAFVARFDRDGQLLWSTFLGGSSDDGAVGTQGLKVAADGSVYVCGFTSSRDFPVVGSAFQAENAGGFDGLWEARADRFVARFSPEGRLVATTLFGGDGRDDGEGLALAPGGDVLLAGFTYSTPESLPVHPGGRSPAARGGGDGLGVVLAPDLDRLLFTLRLGGEAKDWFRACAAGPDGGLWLAGTTWGDDFPTGPGPRRRRAGEDLIVVRLEPH